jgi:hypothetical protein
MRPRRRWGLIFKRIFKKWGEDMDWIDLATHLGVNKLSGECSTHCNDQKMSTKISVGKAPREMHEMEV